MGVAPKVHVGLRYRGARVATRVKLLDLAASVARLPSPAPCAIRGVAMMLANANFTNPRITAAVLLVGLVVGIPDKLWIKRVERLSNP